MAFNRFVVDSNVLISAALVPDGTARASMDRVLQDAVLLFSDPTWDELVSRLKRKKFDRWVSPSARLAFLEALIDFAEWIEISGTEMGCRDPADDKFLETAEAGDAAAVVTGDKDLLALHPWGEIAIVSPADFLKLDWDDGN